MTYAREELQAGLGPSVHGMCLAVDGSRFSRLSMTQNEITLT